MEISLEMVKQLREKTNAGILDCQNALKEAGGDMEKATELLRKKGLSIAAKKAGRVTKEGLIGSYIHLGGKIGVLVEINCETDFVARNQVFQDFVKEVCMQVAAASPRYLERSDVPADVVAKEEEIAKAQIKGKPGSVVEKIVKGKLDKFYAESCLLEQAFVKDSGLTIEQLLKSKIAELGENIVIKRFTRFQVGE